MNVEAVMTTDVDTTAPDTSLRDVARLLVEDKISGMPVVEDGRVVGVISEADILAKERGKPPERGRLLDFLFGDRASAELKLEATTAGDAMTAPAVTIGPHSPVAVAAAKMIDEGVNRLPVVDRDGRLVGIVTRADLVRAFVRTDAELAEEIRSDVLLRALWLTPESVEVGVVEGVVTLTGSVGDRAMAEMLPAFVQRVPGVVSVLSEVTWEDSNGGSREGRSAASPAAGPK